MVEINTAAPASSSRWSKVRAILAGCAVLGVGAAVTLATWTDSEWVLGGGSGDGEFIGTSQFDLQQNTFPGNDSVAFWGDEPDTPGGQLRFQPAASTLTPGDTISAPMQLRTAPGSDAATVTLQGAAQNGSDDALFAAVTYQVYTGVNDVDCRAGNYGAELLVDGPDTALTVGGGAPFVLPADMGGGTPSTAMDFCFVITLPADSPNELQGLIIAPAWEFTADSIDATAT